MRAIRAAVNILAVVCYVLIGLYVVAAVPLIAGWNPVVVLSPSMEPKLSVGSVIYYKQRAFEKIKIGDPITYEMTGGELSTHRVIKVNPLSQTFETKGDANKSPDLGEVKYSAVKGVVTEKYKLPYLGYYVNIINQNLYLILFFVIILLSKIMLNVFAKEPSQKKVNAGGVTAVKNSIPPRYGGRVLNLFPEQPEKIESFANIKAQDFSARFTEMETPPQTGGTGEPAVSRQPITWDGSQPRDGSQPQIFRPESSEEPKMKAPPQPAQEWQTAPAAPVVPDVRTEGKQTGNVKDFSAVLAHAIALSMEKEIAKNVEREVARAVVRAVSDVAVQSLAGIGTQKEAAAEMTDQKEPVLPEQNPRNSSYITNVNLVNRRNNA